MAAIKKILILGVIIPFISIFMMSHNVGALSTTLNLDNYEMKAVTRVPGLRCGYNDGTFDNDCVMTNANGVSKYFTSISFERSVTNWPFKAGDIIEFDLTFYNDSLSSVFSDGSYNFGILDFLTNSSSFQVISIQEFTNDSYSKVSGDYDITTNILMTKRYHFTLMVWTDYTGTLAFTRPNLVNWLPSAQRSSISLKASNYIVYRKRPALSSQDQQNEINETQDAVDDSEDAGDSSSSSAEGASASLLSAITGFFSVITSASPTNCVFNAPLNTHFGNQRLNVDLCSLNLPSQIGALTSIIAIGIIIPFAIHMFKKFINLFRSFQS